MDMDSVMIFQCSYITIKIIIDYLTGYSYWYFNITHAYNYK